VWCEQEKPVQNGKATDMFFNSVIFPGVLLLIVSAGNWYARTKPDLLWAEERQSLLPLNRSVFTFAPEDQPVITTQPADQLECEGHIVSFHVIATGLDLTYTWERKKPSESSFSIISGDANVSYPSAGTIRIANAGGTNSPDGTRYRVVASNATGSVTSNAATLSVNEIVNIIPVATDKTICYGDNYSYQVYTSYPANVQSYQWKKKIASGVWTDLVNGGAISGATSSQLTFTGATPSENGDYKVTIVFQSSGADCNVTSDSRNRKLTVRPELLAPEACCGQFVCSGTAAPLTAQPPTGGSGSYTYQWQESLDGTSGWANISGAAGLSYVPGSQSRYYRIRTTDVVCDTIVSGSALRIEYDSQKPSVNCPAESAAVCAGSQGTYNHSGTDWDASATDNCTVPCVVMFTLSGSTTGTGSSLNGVIFNPGTTTILWLAADSSGNTETCTFSLVVNPLPLTTAIYHN